MGNEWSECTIGDALTLQRGFDITKKEQIFGSVPVVSSGGTKSFHSLAKVKAPGVVLGRKGTLGTVFFLNDDFWPHDTTLWVKDFKGNSTHFIYYFFRSISDVLQSLDAGTSNPALNRNHVHPVEMRLPPLPEQKAIAHVLGSLDDKIELNRRMNETLEGMAQALFKSWFVDFDPVIDNALAAGNTIPEELAERAEVRRQALADGTANREVAKQFPAAFQLTEELGWIPEGWEVNPLGNHLDVLETGRRPKGGVAKYTSGVPSVGAESIFGIGLFEFSKTKFVPEEFFKKMKSGKVESFDVLLYKDGGKPGEFKPRSGMFGEGFPFKLFGINEHVFRIRSSNLGQGFLYYQISSERVFHHFAVRGGKAAIPGINQQEVKKVDFLIPKEDVIKTFNDFCLPIFEKILKSANQSRMLANLRDTLLPKLISGEFRIPDAEKLAEEELA
jgi:type I restriction enzyme, S subunit